MMEVARNGVFYPGQFSFPEIMMLFLGMMLGNVLLLDLYNTLGLPHLDHRVDGLRPAGRRRRRRTLPHRRRPCLLAPGPLAVHQYGQSHGHHRRDPRIRGAGLRRRTPLHVCLAPDLLVPLPSGLPPLGRPVVRHLALGHPLLRPLQGAQELGVDPDPHHRIRRRARPAHALRLLGRRRRRALDLPAHAAEHHADHDPLGYVRPGPGLCRQRPGKLHRRAPGRLRRLADRPRGRQRVDHDGRPGQPGPGQLPDPARLGHHHGADAHLLEKSRNTSPRPNSRSPRSTRRRSASARPSSRAASCAPR